jgi:hypothetical protein
VALVDRFEGDVTQLFRIGDALRVDPAAGLVEILNCDVNRWSDGILGAIISSRSPRPRRSLSR